ncbi:MAG: hypothetical protein KJ666_12285 [Bacteroidetes bacterium]|nr:hypothetical protein [Bacteroidota bacterium]MBU2584049.1 hypothetical protein [Bacteroidota bacterium]
MKIFYTLIFLFTVFQFAAIGQNGNYRYSFSGSVNYITTSKIFLNPRSPDPIVRNSHYRLDKIWSYSFEFRMNLYNQSILAGIGSEILKKQNDNLPLRVLRNDAVRTIEVTDGYELVPIEVTGYYVFPFSGKSFTMVMGGGFGAYIGRHVRKIGDISVSPVENKTTFGFHVMVGAEYFVFDFISVRYEMKFRDPDFDIKSKYSQTTTLLNGDRIQVLNNEFYSRINIDGVNFILGLAVHF